MKIKKGVKIVPLDISMRQVLQKADEIWTHFGQELVVTAGLDGKHKPHSLHYYGRAVDLRTRYFNDREIFLVAGELQRSLGDDYDVVAHKTHIHVEYDPK